MGYILCPADLAVQESMHALSEAKEATHRAYPEAAAAVEDAATSVSETMRTKLVQAEQAFLVGAACVVGNVNGGAAASCGRGCCR